MLIVCGHVTTSPASHEQILALAIAHSVHSRAEPGCLAHNCSLDAENPARLVFVEQWHDLAALRAHFLRPESVAFAEAMRKLSVEPPVMQIFEGLMEVPVKRIL